MTTFAQENSEIKKVSINTRFRYNFEEGNDIWIVYDNILNTERTQVGLSLRPPTNYQALLFRFTYTFKFGNELPYLRLKRTEIHLFIY